MSGFLCDWDNSDKEFPSYPDNNDSLDLDDKFNMQRSPNPGSWSETMYDVLFDENYDPVEIASTPFGSYDNYGIWFDRDGVDQWQATDWGAVDGGTYNTGGVYHIQIIYKKYDDTTGTACPLFFPELENDDAPGGYGVPTGFNRLETGGYEYYPAGISFETDLTKMSYMKVFVFGNSGNGKIIIKDLTVTGCLANMRSIKEDALAELENAKLLTTNKHTQKEIDETIKHIEKSLDADFWIDDSCLDPKHGHKVFDEEKKAVKHLMKILKDKKEDQAVKDEVLKVIDKLMKADEPLVDTVIYDAKTSGSTDPKVIHEIEKSEGELAKALGEIAKEHYDHAVDHFKKAWEHAQKALKHAH